MNPHELLPRFDALLTERGIHFEAVIIGGTALNLLGVISRETRDVDVLEPDIPAAVQKCALEFAMHQNLDSHWFNAGPASLVRNLPADWRFRATLVLFEGSALRLRSLGREELLMSKLWALCDRQIDLQDCIALAPSAVELDATLEWLVLQDGNPEWPTYVRSVLDDLRRRLGYGV